MNSPVDPKPELQPVRRVFLGELFVFVFVFAGAMAVLVGPLAVPVATAGITIAAAVVLSALFFLWLAFTTPTRRAEPRYAFMVLSLFPGLLICVGVLGYLRLTNSAAQDQRVMWLTVMKLSKNKPEIAQFDSAQPESAFLDEIAALEEVLSALGFTQVRRVENRRYYFRDASTGMKAVPVEWAVKYRAQSSQQPEEYQMQVIIINRGDGHVRYFRPGEKWPRELSEELEKRWGENFLARTKAKVKVP